MAFDTLANRHRYEEARTQHSKLMASEDRSGRSYRRGWQGHEWRNMEDDFEHWCAGRENKKETPNDQE